MKTKLLAILITMAVVACPVVMAYASDCLKLDNNVKFAIDPNSIVDDPNAVNPE